MLEAPVRESVAAATWSMPARLGRHPRVKAGLGRYILTEVSPHHYRVRETDLHVYLRGELEQRGWKVRDLAEQCGRKPAVVSRWLALEPHSRGLPDPKSLLVLAEALGLEPLEVFVHAGVLPPPDGAPMDPDEMQIAQILRTFGRQLRSAPADKRALVLQLAAALVDAFVLASNRIIDQAR